MFSEISFINTISNYNVQRNHFNHNNQRSTISEILFIYIISDHYL